jgi:hypothetical protein
VFSRSNTQTVGLSLAVCVVLCVGSGIESNWAIDNYNDNNDNNNTFSGNFRVSPRGIAAG